MTISKRVLATAMLASFWACNPTEKKEEASSEDTIATFSYDFTKSDEKYEMPKILKEISGISFYADGQLVCVQDEDGEVFVYDLNQKKVTAQHQFGPPDDYEGIEKVEDEIYVMRSDGKLLSFKFGDKETREIETSLPGKNDLEGLTYDKVNKRLWLAVKDPSKKAAKGDDKLIYSFDLKSRRIFTELELKEQQFENVGLKGKDWKDFKPSGVAFHPQTGEVYLISSAGHRLIIMSRSGVPLKNIELDKELLKQPEGIAFSPDGTLYIASEGDGGNGYILKFSPTSK
ncbi:SdiA-regulated domain-containing protein [Runella sp. MFBS21]|uniref:SdiA-regulated domain-containing protein n=1 Tax=Runella sp. MFBS21 TaxID=3034018 RepID=UPI0023F892C9|nr:SdiA-regulated domain-containing protein [Runella sp. MFBS21]MDF7820740.1 SdiA-regulated domain-containing protein [Runella sp. MFBS21]